MTRTEERISGPVPLLKLYFQVYYNLHRPVVLGLSVVFGSFIYYFITPMTALVANGVGSPKIVSFHV